MKWLVIIITELFLQERDAFKKSLQETEMALAQRSDTASTVEKMLREKDMQISELMEEGRDEGL